MFDKIMMVKRCIRVRLWFVFLFTLMTACRIAPTEEAICPISDLLIQPSDLPGNQWEEVGSRSYRDASSRVGSERIGTGFSTPYWGIASESVYRFHDDLDALDGFLDLYSLWSLLGPEGTTWSQLNMPSDLAISANDYRLECSVSTYRNVKTCWYIALYDVTVIEFRTTMIIVGEEDFIKVVEILDQKISSCNAK